MSGILPSNVSYFMQRLQGVSVSHFKVHPQTDGNQTSGKIVRFELPSNSLINLKSVRLFFNCVTAGKNTCMPNDVSSFIERCSVYMGGVLVGNGFQGYNVLKHCKRGLGASKKCNTTLSHPEIVRSVSYHNNTAFATDSPEAYATSNVESFCIDDWEGLLGSLEPSIIDSGLFPQITLELTLADDTVCPIADGRKIPDGTKGTADNFDKTGTENPTYTLSEMNLQIEVLGMATSVLDQIVEQRIASVGYLSMPFKNYYSFTSTHNGTSRFNVNSASWDRLWLTYRETTHATKNAPIIVQGYKKGGFFGDDGLGDTAADVDVGRPQYDIGGVLDTNKERYISNYFKFVEKPTAPTAPVHFQLQVNSANIPAYRMTTAEAYAMSINSIDNYTEQNLTLDQYRKNFFCQVYRFCLPESDYNRLATGLDTRSVSAMGSLTTENLDSCKLMMFAETTAELRLGSGRAIEIIA